MALSGVRRYRFRDCRGFTVAYAVGGGPDGPFTYEYAVGGDTYLLPLRMPRFLWAVSFGSFTYVRYDCRNPGRARFLSGYPWSWLGFGFLALAVLFGCFSF